MAWYSILPPQLIYFESWAARIFFVLGILTVVPWATLLIFDLVLYICRMSLYEFPFVGGRTRGRGRTDAGVQSQTGAGTQSEGVGQEDQDVWTKTKSVTVAVGVDEGGESHRARVRRRESAGDENVKLRAAKT